MNSNDPTPAMPYHPADAATEPEVLVITRVVDANIDLMPQLMALRSQSLQTWRWVVIVAEPPGVALEALCVDTRVRLASTDDVHAEALRIVSEASCGFVCSLAVNTTIAPHFLELCAWVLGANPQITCCNAYAMDAGGQRWVYGFEQGERFVSANYAGPTAMFRRDRLDAAGISLPASNADAWEVWLRLAEHGEWGYTIPRLLIVYQRLDLTAPFQPEDHVTRTMLRDRHQARYGALRGRFPSCNLRNPEAFENITVEPPIVNQLAYSTATRRILILTAWLRVGGAERVHLDLMDYLGSIGYDIACVPTIYNAEHNWVDEYRRRAVDVFIPDDFLRLSDLPRFLTYLIRSRGIDIVVVSNSYLGYQLLPYLRTHCRDTTFVDLLHSYAMEWKSGGYPRASIGYQSQFDLTITSGEHVKRWMVERGADSTRIAVCYTNVDTDRWRRDEERRKSVRGRLGLGNDDTLVVSIGRMATEKRPQLLAPIIAAFRKRTRAKFLALALGDGPERAKVERQVRELGLSDVMQVLGRVDDDAIVGYLSAADVFLLPSETEGISVATFEAMAMGVVPVSADVGGQAELVTAECGFLIPHGSREVEAYAEALAFLAADPQHCRRMGVAARERIERHFALRDFGPRMAELLDRARTLHAAEPRSVLSHDLAREWATQIVEYTRQEAVVSELWQQLQGWRDISSHDSASGSPPVLSLYQRFRRTVWVLAASIYHWGVAHGIDWLVPLKKRVQAMLRRRQMK